MSKIISEENPEAKEQSSNAPESGGGAQDKIRKQARQLAYDTRYKVKGQFKDGQKTDAANLKKAYMSQLGKSPAPGPVKQLAKKMLVGEEYDFVDVDTFASDSVKDIIGKVFVEAKNRTYKIRVTDKVSKKTYVRMATREKISQLRSNPNISSVEMTGYGDPYEGQKKDKKAKKDYDGDGKVESPTAEYKGSKDKAIKKSMAKEAYTVTAADKKGNTPAWQGYKAGKKNPKTGENVYKAADHLKNEEFIGEIKDPENDNPDANVKKIDVMKGKNKVIINPNQSESVEAPTDTAPEKPKESSAEKRVRMVKRSILQKKMQAVRSGAGADIVAHNEPEGEVLTEEYINEHIESATEYFYKEGLNEDGLELVIEDLGIDEFTEFVFESAQELNEERAAKKAPKRDYEKVKAAVYAKDAERKSKGTGEYSKSKAAKEKYGDKPAPEGKPEKKVATKKKVEKSVAKAKKAQPAKPASKEGLGSKIRGFVKKGVERHKKAREAGRVPEKRAKEFASGVKSGVKTAVKFAKDVKKVVSKEELEIQENRMAAYTAGAGEGSPASRPTVSKKTADRVGRSSDERAFGNRKRKEGIRLSPTKKYSGKDKGKVVKRANTTGRGTPTQYRKSHEDPDMGRYQQKVTQGSGSIKDIKSSFSNWRNELLGEEGYDRWRDDRLVKYGIGHDGSDRKSTPSRRTPDNQKIKGKTVYQKQAEKEHGKGVTALDIVKKNIEKKHGKGAIMDTKKK